MKSFADVGMFGAFLVALAQQAEDQAARALREGAHVIAEDAKARIGHYDGNDWPQLAESTQEGRVKAGFTPNDPLLRTGALHDAITSEGKGREAVAGVKSGQPDPKGTDLGNIAIWQEMGTPGAKHPIPPRPFLGPAGFAKAHEVVNAVGKAVADTLAGDPVRRASRD